MELIFKIVIFILLFIYLIVASYFAYKYFSRKNEIRSMEVKNKKYELLSSITPDTVKEYLDKYIKGYIDRYIIYKFISKKIIYIKEEDCEIMIKDITKLVYLELSELYLFYIQLLVSIKDDEDLLKYLNNKVKNIAIEAVSNFNSSSM